MTRMMRMKKKIGKHLIDGIIVGAIALVIVILVMEIVSWFD